MAWSHLWRCRKAEVVSRERRTDDHRPNNHRPLVTLVWLVQTRLEPCQTLEQANWGLGKMGNLLSVRGVNDKPRYTKLARADARLCGREVVQWEAEACERKKAWVARRARSRENFAYYEQPLG